MRTKCSRAQTPIPGAVRMCARTNRDAHRFMRTENGHLMGALEDLFEQVEDEPIRGGCDVCDAWQVMRETAPKVWVLEVVHESWCSVPKAIGAETN
jgi:hypothetical protein